MENLRATRGVSFIKGGPRRRRRLCRRCHRSRVSSTLAFRMLRLRGIGRRCSREMRLSS
jgi:hypothetical protein